MEYHQTKNGMLFFSGQSAICRLAAGKSGVPSNQDFICSACSSLEYSFMVGCDKKAALPKKQQPNHTFLMHAQAHQDTNCLPNELDSFSDAAEILCTPPP